MKKRKGFTLVEIMLSFFLLGFVSLIFIACLSSSHRFLYRTKTYTSGTFDAVSAIETKLRDIRGAYSDIANSPAPPADYTLEPHLGNDMQISLFSGFYNSALSSPNPKGPTFPPIDNTSVDISVHVSPVNEPITINNLDNSGTIIQSHIATMAAEYRKNDFPVPQIVTAQTNYNPPPAGVYTGVTSYSRIGAPDNPTALNAVAEFVDAAILPDLELHNNLAVINYNWYETNKEGFYLPGRNGLNLDHIPNNDYREAFPSWANGDFTIISKSSINSAAGIFVGSTRDPRPASDMPISFNYIGKHLMCTAQAGANSGKLGPLVEGPPILVSGLPVYVANPTAKYEQAASRLPLFVHFDACMINPEQNPANTDVTYGAADELFVTRWINIADDVTLPGPPVTPGAKDASTIVPLPAGAAAPLPVTVNNPTMHLFAFNDPAPTDETRHLAQYVSFDASAPVLTDKQYLSFNPRAVVNNVATEFNPNNFTMFVVARSHAAPPPESRVLSCFYSGGSVSSWDLQMTSFTMNAGGASQTAFPSGDPGFVLTATDWNLLLVETAGGIATLTINDNPGAPTTIPVTMPTGAGTDHQIYIGSNPNDPTGTVFSGVDVAEIIICHGTLSPAQKKNVSKYLNDKYCLY